VKYPSVVLTLPIEVTIAEKVLLDGTMKNTKEIKLQERNNTSRKSLKIPPEAEVKVQHMSIPTTISMVCPKKNMMKKMASQ